MPSAFFLLSIKAKKMFHFIFLLLLFNSVDLIEDERDLTLVSVNEEALDDVLDLVNAGEEVLHGP